jgi:hypothetical protein
MLVIISATCPNTEQPMQKGGTTMKTFLIMLAVLLVGTFGQSYAVTSEPQPPAGAPATSTPPPSSAGETHVGQATGGKHEGEDSKQESQERKAIKHTRAAIEQGKAGNAEGLRKHAETALRIAGKAEKRHAEAHLEDGISHLQRAVDAAKQGNTADGTKHAEEALTRLRAK